MGFKYQIRFSSNLTEELLALISDTYYKKYVIGPIQIKKKCAKFYINWTRIATFAL